MGGGSEWVLAVLAAIPRSPSPFAPDAAVPVRAHTGRILEPVAEEDF
jgi:hypothetical protein